MEHTGFCKRNNSLKDVNDVAEMLQIIKPVEAEVVSNLSSAPVLKF